ncbi:MAG: branched-chain amino acid ABC transporter permease [Haloferacaceae archaeon]
MSGDDGGRDADVDADVTAGTDDRNGNGNENENAGARDADRAGLLDRLPPALRTDTALIVAALLGIYVLYVASGVALGYSVRGQLNAVAVVTFYVAVFAMLALALNLQWGYTGLFNIGIVGFMAVGIYTMAIVSKQVYAPGSAASVGGLGAPIWVGMLAGTAVAAILGLIVALPALRLRADYLAIVTIAMSEIVRFTLLSNAFESFRLPVPYVSTAGVGTVTYRVGLGGGSGVILDFRDPLAAFVGAVGLTGPYGALVDLFGRVIEANPRPVVDGLVYGVVLLAFVAGYYWLLSRTGKSPFGRVLKAIREDEDVAGALGKDTRAFKVKAFMLGCALMGLGGILWFMRQGAITPNTYRPRLTFFVWIALIIGGAGSNTGSVVGGAIFAALLYQGPLYLKNLVNTVVPVSNAPGSFGPAVAPLIGRLDPVPFLLYTVDSVRQLQLVIMGVVLVVLMHRRPDGLLGYRTEAAASIPLRLGRATPGAEGPEHGDGTDGTGGADPEGPGGGRDG